MLSPRKHNRNPSSHQPPAPAALTGRESLRQSPSKQNFSPSRKAQQPSDKKQAISAEILLAGIHQLQSIIKNMGGRVPAHLAFGIADGKDSKGILLKKIADDKQVRNQNQKQKQVTKQDDKIQKQLKKIIEQNKRLKIQINNYEFEIKKLQQDQAEFKVLTKMDTDKQIKRYKSQISRLQLQVRQDNNKWQQKFHEMRLLYNKQKQQQIQHIKNATKLQVQQLIKSHQSLLLQTVTKNQQKIQQLTQCHIKQLLQLQQTHLKLLKQKQQQYLLQKQNNRVKHVQIVQKLQKKHQISIINIQNYKKFVKQKQEQSKIAVSKQKQKLYNDLYISRKQKQQLSKHIIQLKSQILKLQNTLQQKQYQLNEQKSRHSQQIDKINIRHIHKIQFQTHTNSMRMKQLLQKHNKAITKYQNKIVQIQKLRQEKQELMQQQYKMIVIKFQERPSKQEDKCQINKLNHQIMGKQVQLDKVRKQLQQVLMEKENNQKNYGRIFNNLNGTSMHVMPQSATSIPIKQMTFNQNNNNNNYHSNFSTIRDRDRQRERQRPVTSYPSGRERDSSRGDKIYKQSHTVDMNFLLKVCNRGF